GLASPRSTAPVRESSPAILARGRAAADRAGPTGGCSPVTVGGRSAEPTRRAAALLARHRDPQPLLRGDQVVGVLGVLAEVDLDPVDRAREPAGRARVVVAHR